jgi:Cu/Ag efflux pump CusA
MPLLSRAKRSVGRAMGSAAMHADAKQTELCTYLSAMIGQIKTNKDEGLDDFHAVVEATVQRSRPVVLTALAAVLAFIPLTFSVFWGSLAYTLIGGTAAGTVLTLVFLPALYSIWFRVKPEQGL